LPSDDKYPRRGRVIERRSLRGEGLSDETLPLHRVVGGYDVVSASTDTRVDTTPVFSESKPRFDPDESNRNSLRIEGRNFALELEGDTDFINTAYDAVRASLVARLHTTVTGQFTAMAKQASSELGPDDTVETSDPSGGYVWVYVCHELYRKIHVVSRAGLGLTAIAKVLDPYSLGKIYVDRKELDGLSDLVGTNKTLWSELTNEGRSRLMRDSQ